MPKSVPAFYPNIQEVEAGRHRWVQGALGATVNKQTNKQMALISYISMSEWMNEVEFYFYSGRSLIFFDRYGFPDVMAWARDQFLFF